MKEEFVTYTQAVKLKELGFDWECNRYQVESENGAIVTETGYHNRIPERVALPTLALAQRWLREVKYIYLCPYPERYIEDEGDGNYIYVCTGNWYCDVWDSHEDSQDLSKYQPIKSYEQALSLGITEALKIMTNYKLNPGADAHYGWTALKKPITEIQMDEERKMRGLSGLLDPPMGITPYRYRFALPLDYDFKTSKQQNLKCLLRKKLKTLLPKWLLKSIQKNPAKI